MLGTRGTSDPQVEALSSFLNLVDLVQNQDQLTAKLAEIRKAAGEYREAEKKFREAQKELDDRERALTSRAKSLDARENNIKSGEQKLSSRERDSEGKEKALASRASGLTDIEKTLKERSSALDARAEAVENLLKQQEKELADRRQEGLQHVEVMRSQALTEIGNQRNQLDRREKAIRAFCMQFKALAADWTPT